MNSRYIIKPFLIQLKEFLSLIDSNFSKNTSNYIKKTLIDIINKTL